MNFLFTMKRDKFNSLVDYIKPQEKEILDVLYDNFLECFSRRRAADGRLQQRGGLVNIAEDLRKEEDQAYIEYEKMCKRYIWTWEERKLNDERLKQTKEVSSMGVGIVSEDRKN
jgi:hypothetical protein